MTNSPLTSPCGRITFRAEDRARHLIDRAMDMPAAVMSRIYTRFDASRVMQDAKALDADQTRRAGPLAGQFVSIKDLFDEAGHVTTAGSVILADTPAAHSDAPAVARLKAAGAVPCGRTTMSEFAYSGVGLNPHTGNTGNARDPQRISGGSSSGGAVSVALGLADIALGTDTGGSVRIPAALNGLAGFKPTQSTVPLEGAFPLSQTFDSIGPLAARIATCAAVHAILSAGTAPAKAVERPLKLAVLQGPLMEGLDKQVAADFDAALVALRAAGHTISETHLPALEGFGDVNRIVVATEAYAIHAHHLEGLKTLGDPRVLRRILSAEGFNATEYTDRLAQRAMAIAAFEGLAAEFDAFILPTVPTVAPLMSEVEADFDRLNALMLRNPSAVNFLDGCAATLPMQRAKRLATGLMIFAPGGQDWQVLDAAQRIELLLQS
ncbi:MAG: amidase family protein [Paracoccaceae bacterium]|uniref:amidase family protein n=1 Tax=Seohaeicola saemankumensis TaxID=481181 RepID=UPI001E368EBD|nr:amidase family protein [Seohaeicola saemankumensis]MCD1626656.1 amidase [Seohaeicola saemankumensis]